MDVVLHPFSPFLPANAVLLMLGSFPPPKKRWSMDFYYPNWNNDMWRIWGWVFWGDKDYFADVERKAFRRDLLAGFLAEKGVALYDTASAVRRLQGNASDKFLEVVTPADLGALLRQLPRCRAIAATGQKAAATLAAQYGIEVPKVGASVQWERDGRSLRIYRMPSTSRAYPLALEKKAAAYRAMLDELQLT